MPETKFPTKLSIQNDNEFKQVFCLEFIHGEVFNEFFSHSQIASADFLFNLASHRQFNK
jgi:hypothetical protein